VNLHMLCCCGDNANPCAPACECASSYIISGITGSLNWEVNPARTAPCTNCDDYDSAGSSRSQFLTITFTQGPTTALAKVAGTCCYKATGILYATYNWSATDRLTCCPFEPQQVCYHNETKTGTKQIPFCYTVVCQPNVYDNGVGWVHSLTMCGFCVGNIQTISGESDNDCLDPDLCNNLPLARLGLCFGGGSYTWHTALKCLDTIQRPADVRYVSWCSNNYDCQVGGENVACYQPQRDQSISMGPFSPYLVNEFTAGNPEPDPCGDVTITASQQTIAINCTVHKDICSGGYDYTTDCCRAEFTYGFSLPYFL